MDTVTSLRARLHSLRGEWPAICQATGLSYWWLTKLAQGRIAEPGIGKIERLQRHLETLATRGDAPAEQQGAPEAGPNARAA